MTDELQPDPSMIGGVPKAPLVFLPEPVALFQARARRFAFLAEHHDLAPYLRFLAELSRIQARLAATLPPVTPVAPAAVDRAIGSAMPLMDRQALRTDPELAATLQALIEAVADLDMPDPARQALRTVHAADAEDRHWLLGNVLADAIPDQATAPHVFAAAAVQVHLARRAATVSAERVAPVSVGVCPVCGGRPVSSSVVGLQDIENVRYASCAGCASQWNEVRVKCLCCGSTKGITYQSVDTVDATVKAEVCRECSSWVKIFHHVRNPSLDPVADDVGSLGLDVLMKDTVFRRGGFNPYLVGY